MSCQKCGGEHSTMDCDDEIPRPCRMSESSFAAPAGCLASIPHKCPKCDGQGIVSKPPWVAGDVHQWSSTETTFQCDVCHGAKIIWSKPDNAEVSEPPTKKL